MGGSGNSGSDKQTNTIRFAPYIEDKHKSFLDTTKSYREDLVSDSPFSGFSSYNIDDAFFGSGVAITEFAALFDEFETYVQDIDVEVLYDEIFDKTMTHSNIRTLIVAEGALLNDDLETNGIPRMSAGSRDINSVMSSTFIVEKGNLEATRLKALAKFSGELKYRLIPVVVDRWRSRLDWNKGIVTIYAELIKLYLSGRIDITEQNYTFLAKDKLWPFTILDYERANLAALQGATKGTSVSGEGGPSQTQKAIGGALSGASAGAVAGPYGAAIGGVLGAAAGFLS